jgi:hypothetical protein
MTRVFAYCRVSTSDQTTDNQVQEIAAAGFTVQKGRAITETVSGSVPAMERKGFLALLNKLEASDVLIVTKLIGIPVALSYIGVSPAAARRSLAGESAGSAGTADAVRGWNWLLPFTRRGPALAAIVVAAALAWLRKGVVATRIGSTYGIAITFEDADPALAARVANTFAQQYTAGALDAKRRTARATTTTIAERLEQLRQQALADTAAVQRYRIANNLLSTTMGTLTEQEISSYNQAVTTARAEASEDGARLDAARQQLALGGSAGGVGEVAVSPAIGALRAPQDDREQAGRQAGRQAGAAPPS